MTNAAPHQVKTDKAVHGVGLSPGADSGRADAAGERNRPNRTHLASRLLLVGLATLTIVLVGRISPHPVDHPAPRPLQHSASSSTPKTHSDFTDRALGLADPSVIGMSQKDLARRFDLIDSTGAAGVRTDLSWRYVQRNEGAPYDWSKFDPIVSMANQHSKPLDAILDYAPPWAAEPGCDTARARCAPADATKFGDFAVAAVTRYAPQGVHTYELWNEPNVGVRWSPQPNAAAYASFVREVCPRIKQADPQATVILGGLALGNDPGDMPMLQFVEAFYKADPGSCWNALSVHLYNPNDNTYELLSTVHNIMKQYGDNRHIWATEVGIETSGICGAQGNPSEALQAAELPKIVDRWRSYPWDGPLFWFDTQDVPAYGNHFGLTCNPAGNAKPSLAVFQSITAVP